MSLPEISIPQLFASHSMRFKYEPNPYQLGQCNDDENIPVLSLSNNAEGCSRCLFFVPEKLSRKS